MRQPEQWFAPAQAQRGRAHAQLDAGATGGGEAVAPGQRPVALGVAPAALFGVVARYIALQVDDTADAAGGVGLSGGSGAAFGTPLAFALGGARDAARGPQQGAGEQAEHQLHRKPLCAEPNSRYQGVLGSGEAGKSSVRHVRPNGHPGAGDDREWTPKGGRLCKAVFLLGPRRLAVADARRRFA